ncbi:MAG: hypothetical protein VR65_06835 [Desulfobulbaceae bacterium BRH_c16a]|nr:MAG: hypothetical protein VR65_06835 [Desulfobulbaceae bacterium BRH_c16a]
MDRTNSINMGMELKNLLFLFVGDLSRGKRMQETVKPHGWKIRIETEVRSVPNKGAEYRPDLVILDGFPESERAISVYYKLQHFNEVLFLALNDSPNAMKFTHVHRLSFLKIINRDPKPKEFIDAIFDLVRSSRKLHLHSIQRGLICDIQSR